uniref:Uncharacterized protein n=1 Tax=Theileria annulata TaxID=5874 RepID=A0A3B0MQS4_THEAN
MLNVYRKCINLWVLYNYHEVIKDKNAGSLKLLLKVRNAKFLKYLYTVIFHCEGSSADPLIQFLLFLIETTDNPTKVIQEPGKSPAYNKRKFEEHNGDYTPRSVSSPIRNKDITAGTDNLINETSDPELSREVDDYEIEAYKVFIDVFLSSLVPILLYTYYYRISTNSQSFESANNEYQVKSMADGTLENDLKVNKFTKLSGVKPRSNQCNIFKSFLNEEERLLNGMNSYDNFVDYLKDGGEFPLDSNFDQVKPETKGIEMVLSKLSLLNLRGYNKYKIPSTMCDIYNRLNNSTLKKQLETSLLYCYRLRCNDLYFKSNNVKLLSKIITTNTTSYSFHFKPFDKDDNFSNINLQINDSDLKSETGLENFSFDMNTVTGNLLKLFNHNLNYIYKVMYNNNRTQMTLNHDKYIKFLYRLICSKNELPKIKSTNTFEYIYYFLLKFMILYSSRRTVGLDSSESCSPDSDLSIENKYNILGYKNLSSDYSIGDCGNIKLLMLVINFNLMKHNAGMARKFNAEILKMLDEMKFDTSNLNLYYLANCHYKLINYNLYINFNEVNYYPLESRKNRDVSLEEKFKLVSTINGNIKLLNKVINKTSTDEVIRNNEKDMEILENLGDDGIQLPLVWKLESNLRISKKYSNIVKIGKKGDDVELTINKYKEILNYKFL